jgi:hypothetical protein
VRTVPAMSTSLAVTMTFASLYQVNKRKIVPGR